MSNFSRVKYPPRGPLAGDDPPLPADRLVGQTVRLDASVTPDASDAEMAIRAPRRALGGLTDTEGLARLLLRAEAVASSHIEGLVISPQRLLRADADRESFRTTSDVDLPARVSPAAADLTH